MTAADIDDFEDLLTLAANGANSKWENEFISQMRYRFDEFGELTFVSPLEFDVLQSLAGYTP
jgi:hypothetical protein